MTSPTQLFHRPTGAWVDLADDPNFPPEAKEIIDVSYRHIRRSAPVLFCSHGHPVYLQRRPPRYVLWAVSMDGSHTHKPEHTSMSDEHRREQEYSRRPYERAGIEVHPEHVLPSKTKPDLVAFGTVAHGVEIQRSHLTREAAVHRTRRAIEGGLAFSVWINDGLRTDKPLWASRVPSLKLNMFEWDVIPPPHTITVAGGLRLVKARRCEAVNFERCPARKRNHCGEWHPAHEPWIDDTVLGPAGVFSLDSALIGVAEGEIRPLRFRGREVILTSPESITLYEDLLGRPAELLFNSKAEIRVIPTPDRSDDHTHQRPSPWPAIILPEMWEQLSIPVERPQFKRHPGFCLYGCAAPARLYPYGWLCDVHRPNAERRTA